MIRMPLIEGKAGPIAVRRSVTSQVYLTTGALDAGQTLSMRQPTRAIDVDGRVHSIYNTDKDILNDFLSGP